MLDLARSGVGQPALRELHQPELAALRPKRPAGAPDGSGVAGASPAACGSPGECPRPGGRGFGSTVGHPGPLEPCEMSTDTSVTPRVDGARLPDGRFGKGNAFGRGNPNLTRIHALRTKLLECA